jgi:hypothetical protein
MIGRLIGYLFVIVAVIVLLRDGLNWYDTGHFALMSCDQIWFGLNPDGFEAAQIWGTNTLSFLWDPIITTILAAPAFVVAAVIGILMVLASRKRQPRRRRRTA